MHDRSERRARSAQIKARLRREVEARIERHDRYAAMSAYPWHKPYSEAQKARLYSQAYCNEGKSRHPGWGRYRGEWHCRCPWCVGAFLHTSDRQDEQARHEARAYERGDLPLADEAEWEASWLPPFWDAPPADAGQD